MRRSRVGVAQRRVSPRSPRRQGADGVRRLPELPEDEVIAHLTQVKGVAFGRRTCSDVHAAASGYFADGDYGVSGDQEALQETQVAKPAVMEKIAKPWAPYRRLPLVICESLDIKTVENNVRRRLIVRTTFHVNMHICTYILRVVERIKSES